MLSLTEESASYLSPPTHPSANLPPMWPNKMQCVRKIARHARKGFSPRQMHAGETALCQIELALKYSCSHFATMRTQTKDQSYGLTLEKVWVLEDIVKQTCLLWGFRLLKVPKASDLIKMKALYCVYMKLSLYLWYTLRSRQHKVEKICEMVGGEELEIKTKNADALTEPSNLALLGLRWRKYGLSGVPQASRLGTLTFAPILS